MSTCEVLVNSMPKRFKAVLENTFTFINLADAFIQSNLQLRNAIMVATQNIDTLGPIWKFSLRGVFTFVGSGLDINGCVWSYFEGTAIYTVIQVIH